MEGRGDELMAEGEKCLSGFSLFSGGGKSEKARGKFLQAATQYKASGTFSKAVKAYKRAADMSKKDKNEGDIAADLEEAARASVKAGDVATAKQFFIEVVEFHDKNQRGVNAAKVCVELSDISTGDEALQWLNRAIKYYRAQGSKVTATELVVRSADIKAQSGDYPGAMQLYDQLARETLDDRVSRGGARKLFFSALLARIAMMEKASIISDIGEVHERFNEYQDLDTQFNRLTREHMLITALIDAISNESVEGYTEAVNEYDSICPLDSTKKKMLERGKQTLEECLDSLR